MPEEAIIGASVQFNGIAWCLVSRWFEKRLENSIFLGFKEDYFWFINLFDSIPEALKRPKFGQDLSVPRCDGWIIVGFVGYAG